MSNESEPVTWDNLWELLSYDFYSRTWGRHGLPAMQREHALMAFVQESQKAIKMMFIVETWKADATITLLNAKRLDAQKG